MYNQFFGLTRAPFAVTPDPSLFYMSRSHREALATIIYGVETGKGFIVCTGEVGTGKTTVVRAFLEQADRQKFRVIYIFTPQMTRTDMTQFLCQELGLPLPESIFAGTQRLHLKLLDMYKDNQTVVLIIDEAQALPIETLEFLRLLSNFETSSEKLLQIVFVGQPELDALLTRQDLRQVNQRVAHYVRLDPLNQEDSLNYIRHRLVAAGARSHDQILSSEAVHLIAEKSGGIPRVMNVLADNVLIAGYGVGERPVGRGTALTTIREYNERWQQSVLGPWFDRGWFARFRPAAWRSRVERAV
jgi:general secretion pathway protein A